MGGDEHVHVGHIAIEHVVHERDGPLEVIRVALIAIEKHLEKRRA